MAGLFEVEISALHGGAGSFSGLSGQASSLAGQANGACDAAAGATAGFGSLGEALTHAGTKLQGALGQGSQMGLSGLLKLSSMKLNACADAYAQADDINANGLNKIQSGIGGLGGIN